MREKKSPDDTARVVGVTKNNEDESELSLRPRKLKEMIGQEKIKQNLHISIQAARERSEPLDHVLLYGPPGLGKTTLSNIIANEMGVTLRITSGPALEKPKDLAGALTSLEPGSVFFIDEIHRLSRTVEEVLYSAMEDFRMDIVIGQGPAARTVAMQIPPFTLIGATTRAGMVSAPMRDRFGIQHNFDLYEYDDLNLIVRRSAEIIGVEIDADGSIEIAKRSRGTPRIANRLLRRVRDYAQVRANGAISQPIADEALRMLDIDFLGLDPFDQRYLTAIVEKFDGGPVGLETLSAMLGEEKDTIEDMVEPFLMRLGFLNRTSRGRAITRAGCMHMNLPWKSPETSDPTLPL